MEEAQQQQISKANAFMRHNHIRVEPAGPDRAQAIRLRVCLPDGRAEICDPPGGPEFPQERLRGPCDRSGHGSPPGQDHLPR